MMRYEALVKPGILSIEDAKRTALERRAAQKKRSIFHREGPRICYPGALLAELINRPVQAVLRPMAMAGPELHKRLEPRFERLCDMSNAGLVSRVERAVLRWLLEEPETEPEPTEYPLQGLQDALVADLAAQGFPPRKRKHDVVDGEGSGMLFPSSPQDNHRVPSGAPRPKAQGAR